MRWDNLKVEREAGARLPGFKEEATVRTFDAPEAIGTRFYEVNARSAINKVPKSSRMPFHHTINPYRGCTHACSYCSSPETPILMGDGRTKPLCELRAGDAIYGTARQGRYRRYVTTHVQAHWSVRKPAYLIAAEDGTELVASGDHRLLTDRGWKYVTGTEHGALRRPHLTPNNRLLGIGGLPAGPDDGPAYRRGYLCGMMRGDGHLGEYEYSRPGRPRSRITSFRLALADEEALWRTREYLADAGVLTSAFLFAAATPNTRKMVGIRTAKRQDVAQIRELIAWPVASSSAWRRGFLAGIFDAEGSHGGVIRISNTDRRLIDCARDCLEGLGLSATVESWGRSNGLTSLRVRGGLREKMRFFLATDPAITRKRSIAATAVKGKVPLRVVSIEPLGEMELFDITTGTGDFIANGVISHNCFARPTHAYLDFNAREDFEREIVVKVNAPELVRAELGRRSWKGEHVALGTNTDPYQWVEGRYRLMEGIWEAMRDHANPCSVLTKSPLLLCDLELMKEIAERTEFTANLSIPTLDERAWRATEPHTPHPRKRIEALAELKRAGIRTGVLIAPLIPGVNDSPQQLGPLLELVAEAGADSIAGVPLHLRGEVREIWFDWLREHRPDLVDRYEALYARGAYMRRDEGDRLAGLVRRGRREMPGAGSAETGALSPPPGRQPRLF